MCYGINKTNADVENTVILGSITEITMFHCIFEQFLFRNVNLKDGNEYFW